MPLSYFAADSRLVKMDETACGAPPDFTEDLLPG
ncbi:hypothetical protein SAMN05421507_1467 [Lentzea jiangxiensis]|uniref:Uncharacterized protein n=1 Tax=Lentzea jiangxiensis TaxID=641025 RepID=A0A1H0X7W2_9PSEU|nr:hypothetical protein SAMN05421507_1467 [Lentzea jiangxiensis]